MRLLVAGAIAFVVLGCASVSNNQSEKALGSLRTVNPRFFGMHLHRLANQGSLNVAFGTLRLWDTGTRWSLLNPSPGEYNWSTLDSYLDWAQSNHHEVIYTFGHVPCWVNSSSCVPGTETQEQDVRDIGAWDTFVKALVTHAKGRIHYYEIWNEFDQPHFWSGSIATLALMGKHAYQIIKSIDPHAQVLTPSTSGISSMRLSLLDQYLTFVQNMSDGKRAYADGIAFHSYAGPVPEAVVPLIRQLQVTVARHGFSKLPIFDTEGSWGQFESLPDLGAQAAFVARSYVLQASVGIDRFMWYGWDYHPWGDLWKPPGVDIPEVCPPQPQSCGPVLLQSGIAYGTMAQWLIGAQIGVCSQSDQDVWSCPIFRANNYRGLILWSATSDPLPYSVSSEFTQSRDLLTNCPQVILDQQILLGHRPLLVETSGAASFGNSKGINPAEMNIPCKSSTSGEEP